MLLALISAKCFAFSFSAFFFLLSHRFRPTKGERLIRLVRRGMRTGKALFLLGIEPGIPRARPWKELLATGAPWNPVFLGTFFNDFRKLQHDFRL
ncbi:cytochrome P450 93A3 [Trifolium repens]|nr:cytochrome P450 93A3 [Trifolium repens]